jgi:hypothetical protein
VLYEELQKLLGAQPPDLPAALDVVERSLQGWADYRVELTFSNKKYPGPQIKGLAGSAVYTGGGVLLFVAKASTDTDGRTNDIGSHPVLETSYKVRGSNGRLISLDAFADAYFVLSQTLLGLCGARSKKVPDIEAGTLGYVKSNRRGTASFAVYGDAGPCHSTGEISVALGRGLGYPIARPARDSAEDTDNPGMVYIVFLGTSRRRGEDGVRAAQLESEARLSLPAVLKDYAQFLIARAKNEEACGKSAGCE